MENLGLTPSNCYVTDPATKDLRCRADHYIGETVYALALGYVQLPKT